MEKIVKGAICILLGLGLVALVSSSSLYEEDVRIADEILGKNPKDNLKYIRPPGEPTNVTINFYVRQVLHFCEEKRKWKVQLTFRQKWHDSRLEHKSDNPDYKYLTYGNSKDIWTPDIFFRNEIEADDHHMMRPNEMLRIYPSGDVLFSSRVTLTLSCDFHDHAHKLHCPISLASYAYPKEELVLRWDDDHPVQMGEHLHFPSEHLTLMDTVETGHCDSTTVTGHYDCLKADFTLAHNVCSS